MANGVCHCGVGLGTCWYHFGSWLGPKQKPRPFWVAPNPCKLAARIASQPAHSMPLGSASSYDICGHQQPTVKKSSSDLGCQKFRFLRQHRALCKQPLFVGTLRKTLWVKLDLWIKPDKTAFRTYRKENDGHLNMPEEVRRVSQVWRCFGETSLREVYLGRGQRSLKPRY